MIYKTKPDETGHSHAFSVVKTKLRDDTTKGLVVESKVGNAHTHKITLSAKEKKDLLKGLAITKTTTNVNGHEHVVTILGNKL
jgi:hypothetical protein